VYARERARSNDGEGVEKRREEKGVRDMVTLLSCCLNIPIFVSYALRDFI
jgi:hypothetical protein